MAKKTVAHEVYRDADGDMRMRLVEEKPFTRDQKKSTQLIGWTKGPGKSKAKRAARALWG